MNGLLSKSDQFAIDFADWCAGNYDKFLSGKWGNHTNKTFTTKELLKDFKETRKENKPQKWKQIDLEEAIKNEKDAQLGLKESKNQKES